MVRYIAGMSALVVGLTAVGCSSSPPKGNPADGGGTGGAAAGTGTGTGSGGTGGLVGGKLGATQCSDGLDNDNDGKIDLADPECVSPLDNDESSFATGIPGDNVDACKQDCFFDGNSGMGNDGCEWQLKCDPSNVGAGSAASCPYDPNFKMCPTTQSAKCINNCRAITPNGCDCFGCCVVPGVNHPIRLEPSCDSTKFNDPAVCPVCTQQTSCMKTCGACQLCIGKTTLDPSCTTTTTDGGAPTPTCETGQIACGTDNSVCPQGTACVTGCCVPWIF